MPRSTVGKIRKDLEFWRPKIISTILDETELALD